MNKESVMHLMEELKKYDPSTFRDIITKYAKVDADLHFKMVVNPKLITEVGDNYYFTIHNIYKKICDAGFYATITDGDVIQTKPCKGTVTDYLGLVDELYDTYPELQKAPILFTSFEQWTPVVTKRKTEYKIMYDTKENK